MRRFYVSEVDSRAGEIARRYGIGLETIDFCCPENMENDEYVHAKQEQLAGITLLSLHAPYYELFPSAIDPMIRSVAMHRFTQALETCSRLGIHRMVVHSGYTSQIYYPQWFVPKSVAFWKELVQKLPGDFELMIENVLDEKPEYIREICDGVGDARVRICLDVGHANAYSEVPVCAWIRDLGSRIAHVHLHNNDGTRDGHCALSCGSMDMESIFRELDTYAPDADICIESTDAPACIDYLTERGYIDVQSL